MPSEVPNREGFFALNFFHSDVPWDLINEKLGCINWASIMNDKNATEMLDTFYDVCYKVCEEHVPKKSPALYDKLS